MTAEHSVTGARFLAHEALRESQVDMINDGLEADFEGRFLVCQCPDRDWEDCCITLRGINRLKTESWTTCPVHDRAPITTQDCG